MESHHLQGVPVREWLEQAQAFREVFQKLPHDCQLEVMKQRDGLLNDEAFVIVVKLNDAIAHTLYLHRVGTEYEEVIAWEKRFAGDAVVCYKFRIQQKDMIVEDVVNDIIERSNDLVADVFCIRAGRRRAMQGDEEPLFSYEYKGSDYYDFVGDENAHKVYNRISNELRLDLCRMLKYARSHKLP